MVDSPTPAPNAKPAPVAPSPAAPAKKRGWWRLPRQLPGKKKAAVVAPKK